MSLENESKFHVTTLHSGWEASNARHMLIGVSGVLSAVIEEARQVAERYRGTSQEGYTFIEADDAPATAKMYCDICNERKGRWSLPTLLRLKIK